MFGSKRSFPVQRSVLSASALLNQARRLYQLDRNAACELIRAGLNDTYLISSSSAAFVMRVYRSGWRSDADVQWEIALLEHLATEGAAAASVARPVRTRSGNPYVIILSPEGRRFAALFEYAPGEAVHDFTPDQARAYGAGAAALHLRMDTFQTPHKRFDLDLYHLLQEPMHLLQPRLAHRPDDLRFLEELSQRLREHIVDLDNRGLTRAICHGDLEGSNAHLDENNIFTFFDFDCGGPGWRAYDLAVFQWFLKSRAQRNAGNLQGQWVWPAFLEGYRSLRQIVKVDEESIPTFVAIRQIWLMGLHAKLGPDHGFGRLDDRYFDDALRLLRDLEAAGLGSSMAT